MPSCLSLASVQATAIFFIQAMLFFSRFDEMSERKMRDNIVFLYSLDITNSLCEVLTNESRPLPLGLETGAGPSLSSSSESEPCGRDAIILPISSVLL
jgi:hypothetical protein